MQPTLNVESQKRFDNKASKQVEPYISNQNPEVGIWVMVKQTIYLVWVKIYWVENLNGSFRKKNHEHLK